MEEDAGHFDEKRAYPRIRKKDPKDQPRVIVELVARSQKGQLHQLSGWSKDFSIKGVFIYCHGRLPVGQDCRCKIFIGNVLSDDLSLETSGKVVRCDEAGIAIQFSDSTIEALKQFRDFLAG